MVNIKYKIKSLIKLYNKILYLYLFLFIKILYLFLIIIKSYIF